MTDNPPKPLSDAEVRLVRTALSFDATDWRSRLSFDEQRRLLATLDAMTERAEKAETELVKWRKNPLWDLKTTERLGELDEMYADDE
jgi:hypothetical protein